MKTRFTIIAIFVMSGAAWSYGGLPDEGKILFTARCAACHNVNKILVGPALAGVYQRRPIDWIIKFVHSSQTVIKSGDAYATALFEKFNKVQMPDHADLTEGNIKSIVEFIKSESVAGGSSEKPPFVRPISKVMPFRPLVIAKDYGIFIIYLSVVAMLVLTLWFAVRFTDLRNSRAGKNDPA